MEVAYLDKIVEENQGKLIPLADATIDLILGEIPKFFIGQDSIDYYTRSRDLTPPSDYSPWNRRGRITLKGVEADGYALYIKFSSRTLNDDSIFIDLNTKGKTTGYVFVPKIGLYLHEECSSRWVQENLLVLAK